MFVGGEVAGGRLAPACPHLYLQNSNLWLWRWCLDRTVGRTLSPVAGLMLSVWRGRTSTRQNSWRKQHLKQSRGDCGKEEAGVGYVPSSTLWLLALFLQQRQ